MCLIPKSQRSAQERPTMAKWYVRTYVRCQAFRGKFSQREKNTNRCKVFSTKNRPQIPKNRIKSLKNAKKRPRAPKSVTKRTEITRAQILGPFWAALGALLGRPGPPRTRPRAPKLEPEANFSRFFERHFSHHISHRLFINFSSMFDLAKP